MSAVQDGNPQKLCVMTEDAELQSKIISLVGVPLLRFSRKNIVLEPPTRESKVIAEVAAQEIVNAKPVTMAGSHADSNEPQAPARRRRHGPKEPNPLSCKKKKKKAPVPVQPKEGITKKHRRRRSRHTNAQNHDSDLR